MARGWARDWVAVTLAIGLATALNVITFAVFYDAIFGNDPGLSENATQILTGWGGGIVGVLGSYIGFKAGADQTARVSSRPETPPATPLVRPPVDVDPG